MQPGKFGKFEKKLFSAFLALGILLFAVPMTCLVFANVLNSRAQYRETAEQSVESRMQFANACFSSVFSMLYDFSTYANVRVFGETQLGSGEYYYYAARVMDDLRSTFASTGPLDFDVAVTRSDADSLVITRRATLPKSSYFAEETALNDAQVQQILDHFSRSSMALTIPVYDGDSLSELYYVMCRFSAGTDCLVLLRIPVAQLFGESVPYVLFSGGNVLAYSQRSEEMQTLATAAQTHLAQNPPETRFFEGGYDVYAEEFASNAWEVAFLYPNTGNSFVRLLLSASLVFLVLAALLGLAAILLTRSLYRPIRQTLSEALGAHPQDAVPDALDEFSILRENTARLKELSAQMSTLMDEQTKMTVIRRARELLLGVGTHAVVDDDFCVGLIEVKTDSDAVLFHTKATLESCVAQIALADYVNCSSETAAVILRTSSPDKAHAVMEGILGSCAGDVDVYATISEILHGSDRINACYKQALQILEYKYLFAECDILTMPHVKQLDSKTYYYPLNIEKSLIQYIVTGGDGALILFDELLEENLTTRKLPPEIAKNFLLALIATISRAFQTMKLSPTELIGRDVDFETLILSWNEKSCLVQLRAIVADMTSAVQRRARNSDEMLLKNMREYIHQNYADDIMLDDLAHAFHISSKYCSALFKKLSDDTFKNYLNHYRVKMAKDMLRASPTLKISELSLRVGFNSSNSFIRVFSKYTGETPKAFAEAVQAQRGQAPVPTDK